ncbi:hypothetical protein GW721_02910 [Citrobacter braakii]|nr:hypothetical protein [Citrobacter braakii]
MTNNKLTDEFLEKLATSRVYPLDRGYIIVGDDLVAMARELQERRKADSAEPIYQYRIRNGYNGQVTEWQTIRRDQVDFVLKAQPLNAEFRIISAPQPAPEREQVRSDYAEDVNSKQAVKIGIYERIYGLLRECPGGDSIYSVAPIEGECIPHGVLAHTGCISFYCNFGHLHIAEPAAFTGCHTHSLSGGTND